MAEKENVVLIANEASTELGYRLAERLWITFTEMERKRFSDGESYHAFPESVSGKDLIILGATHNDSSHQELLDLISGGRYWNAASINVIIPYLGYSTMERSKPGSFELPKGVTRTRQIFRARPTFVAFVDLHSDLSCLKVLPERDRFFVQDPPLLPLWIFIQRRFFTPMPVRSGPNTYGLTVLWWTKSRRVVYRSMYWFLPITVFPSGWLDWPVFSAAPIQLRIKTDTIRTKPLSARCQMW